MESLPVEILIQIISNFCFHCRHPEHFPNADTEETRNDKKLLARLCRTSRAICAVAQPILYHYYATGKSIVETKLYRGYDEVSERCRESDFLPQFVRSIAQRPDLAAQVATMHIVFARGGVRENQKQIIESLVGFSTTNKLLLKNPACDDGGHYYREELHLWLATLAMILTPRLKNLLLAIDYDAGFWNFRDSPHLKMSSLRTLGLVGQEMTRYLNDFEALYAAAPNLQTIYASQAVGWCTSIAKNHHSGLDRELTPSNIRRLAVSEKTPTNLGKLLLCLPQLEDLEYYWNGLNEFGVENFVELLEPVKTTLKRLCIEFLPSSPKDIMSDPFPTWIEPPKVDYAPIQTFRGFESLESLEIGCFLIYCERDRDEADRLIALLPRSIQKLRISYLYKGMDKSLRELAAVAPSEFPLLKDVVIGVAERTDPRYDYSIDRTKALGKMFEDAGIKISFKRDFLGSNAKTMIPGAMAGSRLIPIPRVMDVTTNFELESE